jgi:hypothetical protein
MDRQSIQWVHQSRKLEVVNGSAWLLDNLLYGRRQGNMKVQKECHRSGVVRRYNGNRCEPTLIYYEWW